MPKAKERDGVFQRKDRSGWWVSYVDASGKRKKEKVTAFTRTQAMTALAQIKTRIERESILGVKSASEITTADLLQAIQGAPESALAPDYLCPAGRHSGDAQGRVARPGERDHAPDSGRLHP